MKLALFIIALMLVVAAAISARKSVRILQQVHIFTQFISFPAVPMGGCGFCIAHGAPEDRGLEWDASASSPLDKEMGDE